MFYRPAHEAAALWLCLPGKTELPDRDLMINAAERE